MNNQVIIYITCMNEKKNHAGQDVTQNYPLRRTRFSIALQNFLVARGKRITLHFKPYSRPYAGKDTLLLRSNKVSLMQVYTVNRSGK